MGRAALQHLVETARENHAILIERSGQTALFSVDPPSPSGSPTRPFSIVVELRRGTPVAREQTPQVLPSFCPERHINGDGTFCLSWAELDPLEIVDLETAGAWWRKLLVFLQRQRTAATRRRWPGKTDARAHGSEAAWHQAVAELAAQELGAKFVNGLRGERFTTSRRRRGDETRVRLLHEDRRLATVIEVPGRLVGRVMTLRAPCPCGGDARRSRALRSCGNHGLLPVPWTGG